MIIQIEEKKMQYLEKGLLDWYESKGVEILGQEATRKAIVHALTVAEHAEEIADSSFNYPLLVQSKVKELELEYENINK